jgi:hypothetical protein
MFMKPSITKRMADSLKISLNYKAEPNWLTYLKLQELADRVDLERKRTPCTVLLSVHEEVKWTLPEERN